MKITGRAANSFKIKNMNENRKIVVAVTGSDGAMGGEVVAHLLASKKNFELRLFVYNHVKRYRAFF